MVKNTMRNLSFNSNDALDELPELLMNQKVMVRNNWNRFYGMISEGEEDPSSLHGAYL